jgi:hypothetical protein
LDDDDLIELLKMTDSGPGTYLTKDQIEFYQNNGYLVIPKFLSKEWVAKLKNRILNLVDNYDPTEYKSIFTSTTENVFMI